LPYSQRKPIDILHEFPIAVHSSGIDVGYSPDGRITSISQPVRRKQGIMDQDIRDRRCEMVAELNILMEWMPDEMEPGSLFILENAGEMGDHDDPYWAVLACPECGTLGLITRNQVWGLLPVICGSPTCPAQFTISNEQVISRRPN
jgi:hypothetical protein